VSSIQLLKNHKIAFYAPDVIHNFVGGHPRLGAADRLRADGTGLVVSAEQFGGRFELGASRARFD
jgi:hypothetical protein